MLGVIVTRKEQMPLALFQAFLAKKLEYSLRHHHIYETTHAIPGMLYYLALETKSKSQSIEGAYNGPRKSKTKVIIPPNHNKHTLPNEPSRTRSKCLYQGPGAVKRERQKRDRF